MAEGLVKNDQINWPLARRFTAVNRLIDLGCICL